MQILCKYYAEIMQKLCRNYAEIMQNNVEIMHKLCNNYPHYAYYAELMQAKPTSVVRYTNLIHFG